MDAHPNFAYSTVAVAPSPAASGTTLTVAAGDGALFAQFPFDATVWPVNTQPTVSNAEIVRITGRSGNVLTIQRAVEGTTARTILVGDQIAVVASEKVFTDIEDAIPSIAASNTTYSTGTISITGVGGGVTVSSNTGQRVDISVAAQSVQPETQTFVGGVSASDTLYTSGTVRLTGVGGGVTVSSNTGQRVDISVAAPVAQTVQTQNAVDVTLAGNTAGALALVSSGTMTLAGGNNITLSQAGNAVTISAGAGGAATAISGIGNSQTTYTSGTVNLSVVAGNLTIRSTTGQAFQFSASQTVQAETQTFVGGVAASNTTYTSGTVSITGVGGGITVSSNTGQRIDLSVAAQSVQPETQTFIGGISASNTLYTSGSVRFTGSNAVTVKSGTGQLVVIDVPTQTTQVETQTFVGGIANSQTTYTSGTVSLSELGAITVRSTTGNQYQLSVNAQTTQTQGILSAGVSTGGNTSGNTQVSTGSRLVFVGSNNITISQGTAAGATTLTISGPSVAGAQTGISGIANSQTTYTSGTVSLSELGAVTIRSTTGQIYQVSVNSQTNQAGTVYASSNTFGTSSGTYDARSISIAGSGAVSVAASNSGWVVSAPAQTTQTQGILSAGVSTGGNTLGNTQVSTGSRLVIVGSGNLTASQGTAAGATTITLSVAAGAAQTAISGLANSQTTYTSGTVSLSELGAITIRSTTGNQFQLSVNAQSVQPETQTFLAGAAASNTTYTSGTFTVTGVGGGVTVSSNTGQRIDISVAAPVAQTNQSGNVYASSNTFGTSSGTYDARSISIAGSGEVSVAASNSGWVISSPVQSVQTQGILNVALSTGGNTLGDTGLNSGTRLVLAGGNNITLSGSSAANASTITIIGPTPGAAQYSVGVSTGGNTSGNTGVSGTRIVFAGSNNITLSQATDATGATITISGPTAGAFSEGVSTGGNTAGATGLTGTQMVWVGSSPISLSQTTGANGGTITINAPATSSLSGTGGIEISTNGSTISIGYGNNLADYQNMPVMNASLMTHVSGISKTPFYWNDHIDGDLTAKSLAFKISMVTASQPLSVSVHLGVYTFVNSTSVSLLGSHSEAYVVSSASSVSLSGVRNLIMTGIGTHATLSTISAGEYMLGLMFSATATNAMNFSLYGANVAGGAGRLGGLYPGTNNMSTGTSQGVQAMYGRGSTTVNAMPSGVIAAELVNQGSGASAELHPWIYIRS